MRLSVIIVVSVLVINQEVRSKKRIFTKMKIASKKRKSALLQNLVKDKILKSFPHLKKKDVVCASTGENGPDIVLSKTARKLVGVNFECKNQQKMKTVYDWYRQASKGQHKMTPAVVCKMNTRQPLVVIDLDDFFDLIKE